MVAIPSVFIKSVELFPCYLYMYPMELADWRLLKIHIDDGVRNRGNYMRLSSERLTFNVAGELATVKHFQQKSVYLEGPDRSTS